MFLFVFTAWNPPLLLTHFTVFTFGVSCLTFLFFLLSSYWCTVFSVLFSDFVTLLSECLGWTTWREQQLTLWRGTNLWLIWIYETIRWQIWTWALWAAWSSCTVSGISWKSWHWVASPFGPSMPTATVCLSSSFTCLIASSPGNKWKQPLPLSPTKKILMLMLQ